MQVAHLEARVALPLETLRRRVNDGLRPTSTCWPSPGAASLSRPASRGGRSYLYQVSTPRSGVRETVRVVGQGAARSSARCGRRPRVPGMHDFRAFSDDDPDEKSTDVMIEQVEVGEAGDLVLIRVVGSHFLWKMVRRMVGVLVEVGGAAWRATDIDAFLTGRP